MRYHQILREMSWDEASAIFQRHGVNPQSSNLTAEWKKLLQKHHPDIEGGDTTTTAMINAAYDILKKPRARNDRGGYEDYTDRSYRPRREPQEPAPWAHAGYSGGMPNSSDIHRNDYRDMNFFKKRMWELSDHSNVEWNIQGFDGYFMRHSITVYGSPKIFQQMAEAMIIWQTSGGNPYSCRAVLVKKRRSSDDTQFIIWADGVFYARDPIPFEYDHSMQGRARYDQKKGRHFTEDERLRELLDDLKANGREHEQPEMDDLKGSHGSRAEAFEVGAHVFHKKYGVGRVVNPTIRQGMARVAFTDRTGNVKVTSLRAATDTERRDFDNARPS